MRSQLNISLRFVLSLNPLTFSDAIVRAIDILLGSCVVVLLNLPNFKIRSTAPSVAIDQVLLSLLSVSFQLVDFVAFLSCRRKRKKKKKKIAFELKDCISIELAEIRNR